MANKPKAVNLSANHPLIEAGFIHELDVIDAFGLQWSTWEKSYRTKIPGHTFPSGRWFHRDQLVQWWATIAKGAEPCQ